MAFIYQTSVETVAGSGVKIILCQVHVRFMKRVDLDYSSA